MKTFDELWREVQERSQRWRIPVVQDYKELEYVFNLIKGCKSYLEVGTAEGNGLYVLAHALKKDAKVNIIDFGEKHTGAARDEVTKYLMESLDLWVIDFLGNSHASYIYGSGTAEGELWERDGRNFFEVVFIDAGHTYEDVIADAIRFGSLATKYIIFHDICLPPVKAAIEWYLAQNPQFKYHEFINSTQYGYGIIEV